MYKKQIKNRKDVDYWNIMIRNFFAKNNMGVKTLFSYLPLKGMIKSSDRINQLLYQPLKCSIFWKKNKQNWPLCLHKEY